MPPTTHTGRLRPPPESSTPTLADVVVHPAVVACAMRHAAIAAADLAEVMERTLHQEPLAAMQSAIAERLAQLALEAGQ